MRHAALVIGVVVVGLALLVRRHVISAISLWLIVLAVFAVLAYLVFIWPNMKGRV
jgi:hypothetical protein